MSIQSCVILTADELRHAETLDDDDNFQIGGRKVDVSAPGVAININPDAVSVAAGAAVDLSGRYLAPTRIIEDPACGTYAPALAAYLRTLPWAELDSDAVFAPAEL